MGAKVVSSMGLRNIRGSITAALASALVEWLLIIMLLVNALFGYLITKFARYCELPIPCLLCSRIDNILGKEKAGFYWDMICGNHKKEISSLVYCHFHEKLVDVRGMCETCLFSFATKDKSNAETYRLLVGKLGEEDLSALDEDGSLDDNVTKSLKHCCCCKQLWRPRRQTQTLLQTRSVDLDFTGLDSPLNPKFTQYPDTLEKEAIQSHISAIDSHSGEKRDDSLVHFGYSELKISSDAESDIEASDIEDSKTLISDDPLRDLILDTEVKPFISVSDDDSASEKTVDMDISSHESSQLLSDLVSPGIIQSKDSSTLSSTAPIGHGLEELLWQKIDPEPIISASTEQNNDISYVPDPAISTEMIRDIHLANTENSESVFPDLPKDDNNEAGVVHTSRNDIDEFKELENVQTSSTIKPSEMKSEQSRFSLAVDNNEAGVMHTSRNDIDEFKELENVQTSSTVKPSEMKSEHSDVGVKMPIYLDLSDAYKLAVSSRGRQLSEKLSEQLAGKDSNTSADLKFLLSQLSRGFNLPSTGVLSPRVSRNLDELKSYDSSASVGMKLLQKKLSLERNDSRKSLDRNESGVESLDFSTVSEIEGESELDKLKRQLEHDRRFTIALVKELEEERNASAISANQTMAMIMRLQEEKAALQMEASHGLRMMEEQAEYDMDALDKLNDLVAEKEKEIQDLEAELEYYRNKYPNESFLDNLEESGSEPSREVEDEKEYISECLKNLDQKLNSFCHNIKSGTKNEEHLEKQARNSIDLNLIDDGPPEKSDVDENSTVSPSDSLFSTESRQTLVSHANPLNKANSTGIHREADMISILDELSRLNEWLQALESDHSFIERVTNVLKNGEEGLIQEIASHLRELRKMGIRRH